MASTDGDAGPRRSTTLDCTMLLLRCLAEAAEACRIGEAVAASSHERASFGLLVLALRHLALIVATAQATRAPLTLSLGRTGAELHRVEVTVTPRPHTLPA